MQASWRKELELYLVAFVASHRGLKLGRLFGVPAAYAGRQLFACAIEDGITARLPASALEAAIAKGAASWTPRGRSVARSSVAATRGRRTRSWVIFRPRSARALETIAPFLEIAARHVALDAASIARRSHS